jgi:hypothetical protein
MGRAAVVHTDTLLIRKNNSLCVIVTPSSLATAIMEDQLIVRFLLTTVYVSIESAQLYLSCHPAHR